MHDSDTFEAGALQEPIIHTPTSDEKKLPNIEGVLSRLHVAMHGEEAVEATLQRAIANEAWRVLSFAVEAAGARQILDRSSHDSIGEFIEVFSADILEVLVRQYSASRIQVGRIGIQTIANDVKHLADERIRGVLRQ